MFKKNIFITGASRGVGKQLALRYATMNVNLILIARQRDLLQKVADSCQQLGANTIIKVIDVRDAATLKAFILEIDDVIPVDLVIANAGVSSTLQRNWQQEKEQDVENTFETNLQGTLNTINPFIGRMVARKSGQIAIMSSIAGLRGVPQSPSYCASKAALDVYGQSLRAWLSRYNVKVNVICPGYIESDMSNRLTGPKPFLMSGVKAANIIQKGLKKNKSRITFPWPLHILITLAKVMPTNLVNALLNRFESYAKY